MDYWSFEIDLVTRRFCEDSGIIWRPEGRGGARRFSLDPEIVIGDPEVGGAQRFSLDPEIVSGDPKVPLDHEVLFGTRRSFL